MSSCGPTSPVSRTRTPTRARRRTHRADARLILEHVGRPVGGVDRLPVGAVGSGPGGDPIGSHRQRPATLVDEVMMCLAERQQIVEVGWAVVAGPPADVMDAARLERHRATRMTAGAMHRPQRPTLLAVDGALGPAGVEHFAGTAQHRRDRRRRRTASVADEAGGEGWPSLVSHNPWLQQSSSNRSSVVTTQISGTVGSASDTWVTPRALGRRPQVRSHRSAPDAAGVDPEPAGRSRLGSPGGRSCA